MTDAINKNSQSGVESNETPKKKNKNIKKIIILLLVVYFLVRAVILISAYKKQQANLKPALVENTFYAANYQDEPVIFYKYWGMMYGPGEFIGPTYGEFMPYSNIMSAEMTNAMMNVEYVDYNKLQNPRKLFSFDTYATIENILTSSDNTYLIISFVGGKMDDTNYIYQSNLQTGISKQIWVHKVRTGDVPLNSGYAYITQFIPDRYVVFDIIQGNPPPDELPQGSVILNMQTGIDKILPPAGDLQIHSSSSNFTYKVIKKVVIACQGLHDPQCAKGDTEKFSFLPTGSTVTESLP